MADVTGRFNFGCAGGNYLIQIAPQSSNTPQSNYYVSCGGSGGGGGGTGIPNSLSGFDSGGNYANVTIGTGLTLSGNVLSAPASGGNTTSTSLTTNYLPKANGANSIINSLVDEGVSNSLALTISDANGVYSPQYVATNTGSPDIFSTQTAPGPHPSSGKMYLWADSTDLRLHDENVSGVIGTTAVAGTCSTSNWHSGMSTAGIFACTQPQVGDVVGAAPTASPTFTGTLSAPSIVYTSRGAVSAPATPAQGSFYWSTDQNYGMAMELASGEAFPVTYACVGPLSSSACYSGSPAVSSGNVMFAIGPLTNAISWTTQDCFQVSGLPSTNSLSVLNGVDMAVSIKGATTPTSTITVTLAGTANSCQTGALTSPTTATATATTATAAHYAQVLNGNTTIFNRLLSSTVYSTAGGCPLFGSIKLCSGNSSSSDKVTIHDLTSGNDFVLLQRYTGDTSFTDAAQIGDTYGAVAPGGMWLGGSSTAGVLTLYTANGILSASNSNITLTAGLVSGAPKATFSGQTVAPVFNATTGFQINGGATNGHCLVGNGTNYVDNSCSVGSGTVTSSGYTSGTPLAAFSTSTNITPATSSNVIALFSGTCSSSTFLRGDGSCNTPGGGGFTPSSTVGVGGIWNTGAPLSLGLTASGTITPNNNTLFLLQLTSPFGFVLGHATIDVTTGGTSETFYACLYNLAGTSLLWSANATVNAVAVASASAAQYTAAAGSYLFGWGQTGTTAASWAGLPANEANLFAILNQNTCSTGCAGSGITRYATSSTSLATGPGCPSSVNGTLSASVSVNGEALVALEP
jgi:hypothetical protein